MSGVARCAVALKRSYFIDAGTVHARIRHALVRLHPAQHTCESQLAHALKCSDQVMARSAVGAAARVGQALVKLRLANPSRVACHAAAIELSDAIKAAAVVEARSGVTFIKLSLAPSRGVASRTNALETIHQINALATVGTWRTLALINFDFTPHSGVARVTGAGECSHTVDARSVDART